MDKIRFGIIGAAGRGSSYVRTLQAHAATEITALCDIRAEEVRQHAVDLGIEHAFTDAGEMIDAGVVDAVVVGTPMPFHASQAIRALESDIHVLSEVTAGVSVRGMPRFGQGGEAQQRGVYDGREFHLYEVKCTGA